eukprot:352409-Chlamydomonas_euryale.AAC.2
MQAGVAGSVNGSADKARSTVMCRCRSCSERGSSNRSIPLVGLANTTVGSGNSWRSISTACRSISAAGGSISTANEIVQNSWLGSSLLLGSLSKRDGSAGQIARCTHPSGLHQAAGRAAPRLVSPRNCAQDSPSHMAWADRVRPEVAPGCRPEVAPPRCRPEVPPARCRPEGAGFVSMAEHCWPDRSLPLVQLSTARPPSCARSSRLHLPVAEGWRSVPPGDGWLSVRRVCPAAYGAAFVHVGDGRAKDGVRAQAVVAQLLSRATRAVGAQRQAQRRASCVGVVLVDTVDLHVRVRRDQVCGAGGEGVGG